MKTQIKKTTNISDSKLALMLKFVIDKNPTIKNNFMMLSLQIDKEFGIYCPCSRIEEYYAKITFIEDFELEGRKVEYGSRI